MKTTGLALILALAMVVGCNPPNATDETAKSSSVSQTDGKPSTTTSAGTDAAKPTDTAKPAAGPSLADLPADLKTDAFEYEGLANDKPMDMEMTRSTEPTIMTGALITTLKSIKGDEATFEQTYSGGLAALGSMTLSLKKDGIRATSSTVKLTDDGYELPTGLTVGKTWKSRSKGDVEGHGPMDSSQTIKVVGIQPVKTKGGTYPEALVVVSSGPASLDQKKGQMTSKRWFVKNKGLVKMQLELKQGDKPITLVLQESGH